MELPLKLHFTRLCMCEILECFIHFWLIWRRCQSLRPCSLYRVEWQDVQWVIQCREWERAQICVLSQAFVCTQEKIRRPGSRWTEAARIHRRVAIHLAWFCGETVIISLNSSHPLILVVAMLCADCDAHLQELQVSLPVSRFRRLVASLSQRRPGFEPMPV